MTKKFMEITVEGQIVQIMAVSQMIQAFVAVFNPSQEEENDISKAIDEALRNCIDFAYPGCFGFKVTISCELLKNKTIKIIIKDYGVGIEDVEKAIQPLYTTKSEYSHSGMGFTIMQNAMSEVKVESSLGKGTTVIMIKQVQ